MSFEIVLSIGFSSGWASVKTSFAIPPQTCPVYNGPAISGIRLLQERQAAFLKRRAAKAA
jgi:hypothetical protein